MTSSRQRDLFQPNTQSDLFGEDTPTPEYGPNPDSVRADLYKILAEARAAPETPMGAKNRAALPDHLSADDELAARRGRRAPAL